MEQSRYTAKALKRLGAIKTSSVVSVTPQRATEINDWAVLLWGTGMRTRADKLRALGWKPKTEDWVPFITEMARAEIETKRVTAEKSTAIHIERHRLVET